MTHCSGCLHLIHSGENALRALEKSWHVHCFVCNFCKGNLGEGGSFVPRYGFPYCGSCENRLWGTVCDACGDIIIGKVLKNATKEFHESCFTCSRCGQPLLRTGYVIIRGNTLCTPCSTLVASNELGPGPGKIPGVVKVNAKPVQRHIIDNSKQQHDKRESKPVQHPILVSPKIVSEPKEERLNPIPTPLVGLSPIVRGKHKVEIGGKHVVNNNNGDNKDYQKKSINVTGGTVTNTTDDQDDLSELTDSSDYGEEEEILFTSSEEEDSFYPIKGNTAASKGNNMTPKGAVMVTPESPRQEEEEVVSEKPPKQVESIQKISPFPEVVSSPTDSVEEQTGGGGERGRGKGIVRDASARGKRPGGHGKSRKGPRRWNDDPPPGLKGIRLKKWKQKQYKMKVAHKKKLKKQGKKKKGK